MLERLTAKYSDRQMALLVKPPEVLTDEEINEVLHYVREDAMYFFDYISHQNREKRNEHH